MEFAIWILFEADPKPYRLEGWGYSTMTACEARILRIERGAGQGMAGLEIIGLEGGGQKIRSVEKAWCAPSTPPPAK